MHTFIELWDTTDRWEQLSTEERKRFMEQIGTGVQQLASAGVESLGWGFARDDVDAATDHRFFAIWQAPDEAGIEAFQRAVADSGWYELFAQVNVSGKLRSPDEVIDALISGG